VRPGKAGTKAAESMHGPACRLDSIGETVVVGRSSLTGVGEEAVWS
jgi:hypothetical protein